MSNDIFLVMNQALNYEEFIAYLQSNNFFPTKGYNKGSLLITYGTKPVIDKSDIEVDIPNSLMFYEQQDIELFEDDSLYTLSKKFDKSYIYSISSRYQHITRLFISTVVAFKEVFIDNDHYFSGSGKDFVKLFEDNPKWDLFSKI